MLARQESVALPGPIRLLDGWAATPEIRPVLRRRLSEAATWIAGTWGVWRDLWGCWTEGLSPSAIVFRQLLNQRAASVR